MLEELLELLRVFGFGVLQVRWCVIRGQDSVFCDRPPISPSALVVGRRSVDGQFAQRIPSPAGGRIVREIKATCHEPNTPTTREDEPAAQLGVVGTNGRGLLLGEAVVVYREEEARRLVGVVDK